MRVLQSYRPQHFSSRVLRPASRFCTLRLGPSLAPYQLRGSVGRNCLYVTAEAKDLSATASQCEPHTKRHACEVHKPNGVSRGSISMFRIQLAALEKERDMPPRSMALSHSSTDRISSTRRVVREIVTRPKQRRQNNVAAGFPIQGVNVSGRMGVPESVASHRGIHFLIPAGNDPPLVVKRATQPLPII